MLAHLSIFCPIFNPVRKAGTLTEPKPKASDCFTVFRLSSPNTLAVFMTVPKSKNLPIPLISWYLNTPFSFFFGIALFASGVGRYYGGRSCFSSYQQSKRSTLVIVGSFLPLLSKIPLSLN